MNWKKRKPVNKISEDDSVLEQIAKIRGIDLDSLDDFLNPTKDVLHNPLEMLNMKKVASLIVEHIKNGSTFAVSYDADADGICSGTIMTKYLLNYVSSEKVHIVYNQRGHGHGIEEQTTFKFLKDYHYDKNGNIKDESRKERYDLNTSNIEKIKQADVLIIVDSSSNDWKTCKAIKDSGTEVIILDHHKIEELNKYALIVNPQQEKDKYPNKNLSGAGVVFKTVEVIEKMLKKEGLGSIDVWQFTDLVAVGMYADSMDITNLENRFLIMDGFRNINNVGLTRILKGAKADFYKINADTIGFSVAPMINGVTRLDNIELAIDIFLTDDDSEAKKLRLKMEKLNVARKEKQKEIVDRYSQKVDTTNKIIFISDDESSKGFNGLVAQNLSTKYSRNAIVGRLSDGIFYGSYRSYNNFDMLNFLKDTNLCDEVKGHNGAGGIVIKEENIDKLMEYIQTHIDELETEEEYVYYDVVVDLDEINEYIKALNKFNLLHGRGFPKVIVRINDVMIDEVKTIGKTQETRKFATMDNLDLIKFKVDDEYGSELVSFDAIDCIGDLSVNEFYNFATRQRTITNQLKIIDYRQK